MYHRLDRQIECGPVDSLDRPGQWPEYGAEVNGGKIESYNSMNSD